LIEASPIYITPRVRRIEARLAGKQTLVLNAEPSQQAARIKTAGVSDLRIWQLPYRTLQRRMAMPLPAVLQRLVKYMSFIGLGSGSLYKGRILHLKGRFSDERGAIAYYQRARPMDRDLLEDAPRRKQAIVKSFKDQWKERTGNDPTDPVDEVIQRRASMIVEIELEAIGRGKLDASYWLGLIQYDQQQYASALDYFLVRVLRFGPEVPWASGAHYNIARCYEARGERPKAIDEYESSPYLRNDPGNQLRARWLKSLDSEKPPKPEAKKAEERRIGEKTTGEDKAQEKKPEAKKIEVKKPDE